jgi:hypothetical protein
MATPEAGICSTSNAEIIFPVMDKIKKRSPDFSDAGRAKRVDYLLEYATKGGGITKGITKGGITKYEGPSTKGDGPR